MMVYNLNMFIFLSLIILSLMIGLNSVSVFYLWFSIEVNMMSFIPMILYYNNYYNFCSIKYFLIQSFSSSLMLLLMLNLYYMNIMNFLFFMLILSLFMKLGYFPFHMWYLNILKDLDWMSVMLLMSIQKLLPFYKLWGVFKMINFSSSNFFESFNLNNFYMIILILMSLNIMMLIYSNNSVKFFMGVSSINHMSWMILLILIDLHMWSCYYMFYIQILTNLILIFNMYNVDNFNYMYMIKSKIFKFLIFFLVLMLMMMPPLIGFFLKMFSIELFMEYKLYFITYLMLNLSVFMSYYYLSLMMSCLLINSSNFMYNMNINIQYMKIDYSYFFMNLLMMFLYSMWML
uniref:NADH-ubiquinone oxidoreductase chain 2 n=1 Tax=Synergus sp. 1 DYB-20230501 TaxID=3136278 RepID=A0AAU6QDE7_9HYME